MKRIGPNLVVPDDYLPRMQDAYSYEDAAILARDWPTLLAMAGLIEKQRDELLNRAVQTSGQRQRQSTYRPFKNQTTLKVPRELLGTMTDKDLAAKFNVANSTVRNYRLRFGIPRHPINRGETANTTCACTRM